MGKRKREQNQKKTIVEDTKVEEDVLLEPVISSDEPPLKQAKWVNRQRVLIFSSRGISPRGRHLMIDLRSVMPHSKADSKMDRKDKLIIINEGFKDRSSADLIYTKCFSLSKLHPHGRGLPSTGLAQESDVFHAVL